VGIVGPFCVSQRRTEPLYICPHFDTMPAKPPEELTGVEIRLLNTAAKLHAAVRSIAETPPTLERQSFVNAKVKEEIVSTYCIQLHTFPTS
jgi:hypothetical protein